MTPDEVRKRLRHTEFDIFNAEAPANIEVGTDTRWTPGSDALLVVTVHAEGGSLTIKGLSIEEAGLLHERIGAWLENPFRCRKE